MFSRTKTFIQVWNYLRVSNDRIFIFGSTIPLNLAKNKAHYHKKSHKHCCWNFASGLYSCCLYRRLTRVWSQSSNVNDAFPHTKTALTQISDALFEVVSVHKPIYGSCRVCERSYRWKEIRPTLPQRHTEENQSRLHASSLLKHTLYLHFLTNDWNYYITQQQLRENVIWHAAQTWNASC